ncbi:MAG: hypothetical protein OEZ32_00645 [Nitrospinota bacterium]|nr:hypothetical protein [Nitrospinota bacterium]
MLKPLTDNDYEQLKVDGSFTLYEVCFLWCGFAPPQHIGGIKVSPLRESEIPLCVGKILSLIIGALDSREYAESPLSENYARPYSNHMNLQAKAFLNIGKQAGQPTVIDGRMIWQDMFLYETKVSRDILKDLAKRLHQQPAFLFPKNRKAQAQESMWRIESPVKGKQTRQAKAAERFGVLNRLVKENPSSTHDELIRLYREGKYKDRTQFPVHEYSDITLKKTIRQTGKKPHGRPRKQESPN